jgi:hypothetical protein
MNIQHKHERYFPWGSRVRVNHQISWFHGCIGTILGQGRWGYLLVEMEKDGRTHRTEIKRGYLEPVQDETLESRETP